MDTYPTSFYKGFAIYPLIYPFNPPREWHEKRPDRAYSVSVVICREGETMDDERSRVFRLRGEPWDNVGAAKRAATHGAEEIIDGLVPGQSMAGE
ncbi:hypothetical protein ACTJK6_21430 [Ralstonia sp. 22086]|jgi:hypothetical protein|uniref:Uncharacterized protein n=1 Tax=Ralstonia wenshanensis TaxID=2842456 RepID=A0AAD2EQR2_9RALS|nr:MULTISPECIES: hypothetical protein [Ralstonia]MCT7308632.1 hypothetical protein [Ralstonia wenshanensis]TXD59508.1 hypothetical protein FUT88_12715 [Ralstonia sp. TCR112]UGS89778.1 hypothetical protein KOL96_17625 [Ralstonia wenshanensis]CAJ0695937.1 hypothetical protein LMG18091_02196 [Ralstonia wenshanensis]CAJ0703505.1 hypothetical protein LMG18102_03986 [Ralstonia mannitolilytica]